VDDRIVDGVRAESTALRNTGLERLARYHGDKAEWVLNAWGRTWTDPAFTGWSLNRELRSIQCPALIMHGDEDEYASPTHPEHMKRLIPSQTTIEIVPSCGHIPHRQKPAEVLGLIRSFLDSAGNKPEPVR
jgi:pimeloyl-ACP methyl ester carboxylesterase